MKKISQSFLRKQVQTVLTKLDDGKQVRKRFDGIGKLYIDRSLPFLCIFRKSSYHFDSSVYKLITAESSYFLITGDSLNKKDLKFILKSLIMNSTGKFGAFLILEVFESSGIIAPDSEFAGGVSNPVFRIHTYEKDGIEDTIKSLSDNLNKIKILRKSAKVDVVEHPKIMSIDSHQPIFQKSELRKLGCFNIGLEIGPIYRDLNTGDLYPQVLQLVRKKLSHSLKHTFHTFVKDKTNRSPGSYLSLGRRMAVKAVWEIDAKLAQIAGTFDLVLKVTPVNVEQAWNRFHRKSYKETPVFQYRPIPIDPLLMKRKLLQVPIERIEDITLEELFREKQIELDRQLTLLMDIRTAKFKYGSIQLYEGIDTNTINTAKEILDTLPPRTSSGSTDSMLDANQFAEAARNELHQYRQIYPELQASVHIRDDLFSGLMVSKGNLLIGSSLSVPQKRVRALINHEVGTHVVTYYNGKYQPFRNLCTGLAGYDEMQEGLAVVGEYLSGGLDVRRLRLLAARVIAAKSMMDGASFIEVFTLLSQTHNFNPRTAFIMTMRVFRGGGLIKDAVYLRGLIKLLDYLKSGGNLEILYIGKIGMKHIPIIKELRLRKILKPIPLRPPFLDEKEAVKRLTNLQNGCEIVKLVS